MIPLLYALFFLSGAAGLMYESVWARYLGLFVGHEAYAQVLVLVIFLGGMSVGAWLVARRADGLINPLRSYGLMEVAVGALGLVFHPVFVASTGWAYSHGFPVVGPGLGIVVLKWVLSGLLILPQSILLGTTFPLMSAGVLRLARRRPGRVLGLLYFTNSLGAALGVLVAGFAIVARWGLPGVLHSAAGINILVGAAAWVASGVLVPGASYRVSAQQPAGGRVDTDRGARLLLAAAFLTAVASFCYEIDWIRMLSLVLGSATHSFDLMLSAFILGLALGSLWIRNRVDRLRDPVTTLAIIQVAMGLLAVATLPVYLLSFHWMDWLLDALGATASGYVLFTVIRYGFCLAVMLPATFCAGMTLPLITRTLLQRRASERAIGQVYAFNTVGSILGAIIAALALMPVLGLKGLLVFAGLVDIGVGGILLAGDPGRRRVRIWIPLSAAAAVLIALGISMDRRLLASGVYRGGGLDRLDGIHLDYYADGRTATVAVTRAQGGFLAIRTNGKVDASLSEAAQRRCDPQNPLRQVDGDEVTQILSGLVPMGFLSRPADVAVIGLGSGITTHTLLADPAVRSVTTIEIEPRMVDGARYFAPANGRAFDDPRSRIVIGDARAVFAGSGVRFDLIVSEPSNPWVSGVSSLFTQEFYRRVIAQLAPDGVFAQWLQTYELDDGSVLRVLRAIDAEFPDWQVYQAGADDLLILATPAGRFPTPHWDAVAALPLIKADLCGVFPLDGAALEATFLADRVLLGSAARRGPVNSDYHPVLDAVAERRRFEGRGAEGFLDLGGRWLNNAGLLMNRRSAPVSTRALTFAELRRAVDRETQTWQTAPAADSAPTAALARVRYQWERWQEGLLQPDAPTDWRAWVADLQAVARIRHAGTAGWTDEEFFQRALDFAARHGAPDPVRQVIRFRRAMQGWQTAAALDAAERLGNLSPADLVEWIPIRELVDGAVIAAASLGRTGVAKAWLARFGKLTDRDTGSVLSRILEGLVGPSDTMPSR